MKIEFKPKKDKEKFLKLLDLFINKEISTDAGKRNKEIEECIGD